MAERKKYLLLEEIMYEKRITPTELAKRLNTSASKICNWKSNRANPRVNRLHDIADALGVSIYDLIAEKKPI